MAEGGLDVEVIDKAVFPRDKICGDGLTALALRMLEQLGVDPSGPDSWKWVDECLVRSPSGHEVAFPIPRHDGHHVAVVPRMELDHALVDRARGAGATVTEGTDVVGAVESSDAVEVVTGDGQRVRARWAVAADGMWSPMRKYLGVASEGYRGEWHAFRQYFADVSGPAAEQMAVYFEADLLPGYFWTFPLPGNRANVGFGVQRGGKVPIGTMGTLWDELLQRPHIRALLGGDARGERTRRAWPIPARVDSVLPATTRTMFVGDAVAACDVMTGEGIGQALLTGILAGREVIRDGPRGRTAAGRYAASMRRDLVADHRMSALLVRALKHRKGARAAVRVAGATPWTRRHFGRWLFEDYPRAVLVTPRRWSRGMLTPPGSFAQRATGATSAPAGHASH